MTAVQAHSVRIGARTIPVVLPNRRDPRLHTAAVIITIHVIGITELGFEVSVPQIVTAIVTAGLIDVGFTLARSGRLIWPASGMLTGSGVALILRYGPTSSGQYWSWDGWYWFAAVAGLSVLTKYLVRFKGNHIFNPSNIGLVLVFLIVPARVLEPLDFWWSPLDFWMLLAYVVIIGGGMAITHRLRLLEMAAVFWVTLIAGLGILAASGHCMIATWSTTPVCGSRFWATLATSPEILIFLFFMITDPKTIPTGRGGRVAFAASLGIFTTLMIAPHTLEYGSKVGLLASLAIWSAIRVVFSRVFPATVDEGSGLRVLARRLARPDPRPSSPFNRGLALGSSLVLIAVAVVLAGTPAREVARAAPDEIATGVPIEIDASALPAVIVDPSTSQLDLEIDDAVAGDIAITLAEDLALETEAVREADAGLLALASGGERLTEMQARIDDAITLGSRQVDVYQFETLRLRLAGEDEGQTSAALAFDATGTVEEVTYDSTGTEIDRSARDMAGTFILRRPGGGRWLIVRADET